MTQPGRPSPHLIPWPGQAVVVIPAADFAELAVWLAALIDLLEGRERPGSVRQVAVTSRLRNYAGFMDRAAAAVSRAGPLGPQSAALAGDGAEPAPWPEDAIVLREGGQLVGRSPECLRQLIHGRKIRGWRDEQGWHVSRQELIAYYGERQERGEAGGGSAGDAGGATGGGSAGDGRAA